MPPGIRPKRSLAPPLVSSHVLDVWALSRLMKVGFVEDELLNVADFDGIAGKTLSLHAATTSTAKIKRNEICPLNG